MDYYDLFNRSVCVNLKTDVVRATSELDSTVDTQTKSPELQLTSASKVDEESSKLSKPLKSKPN